MTRSMAVTVCQLHDDPAALEDDWQALIRHVAAARSDLVLLPEMPFAPWLAAAQPPADPAAADRIWATAVADHAAWLGRLGELGSGVVAGTRPVVRDGRRLNEGFVWTADGGACGAHAKAYLPDESGFWEASWYERGPQDFAAAEVAGVRLGFLICTELWFGAAARGYMTQGIHLLLCPRATPLSSVDKWIAGGRVAGVVAGAYCLSSNRCGESATGGVTFGGGGWVTGPEGEVLAVTGSPEPFQTVTVDLEAAEAAKATYPRYVVDRGRA